MIIAYITVCTVGYLLDSGVKTFQLGLNTTNRAKVNVDNYVYVI